MGGRCPEPVDRFISKFIVKLTQILRVIRSVVVSLRALRQLLLLVFALKLLLLILNVDETRWPR